MTARLRILELPSQTHGDEFTTPFAIVIDRVPADSLIADHTEDLGAAAKTLGAAGALVFVDEIDIEQ